MKYIDHVKPLYIGFTFLPLTLLTSCAFHPTYIKLSGEAGKEFAKEYDRIEKEQLFPAR
jgi:hypothetical protein